MKNAGSMQKSSLCRRAALRFAMIVCASGAILSADVALAQIARVLSSQGIVLVERPGQKPRIVGVGEQLQEKDVIRVAQDGQGVLEFRDNSRITLRANTVFRVDAYADTPPERASFGLTKGGFRSVSGDIAKRNPSAIEFRTPTVILGVRGTEFDARLCDGANCSDPNAIEVTYVWVHEGTVRMDQGKEGSSEDVTGGNLAAAGKGKIARLEAPPEFMKLDKARFDSATGAFVLPVFRRPDGSIGMCK